MKPILESPIFKAIDQAPGYCFITDNTAKIVYSNQAILDHTGYAPAEAIGKNPSQLWGGHMPRTFYQKLWESLCKKHESFVDTATNTKKNGSIYTESIHILPIFKEKQPKYFVAIQPIHKNSSDGKQFFKKFKNSQKLAEKSPHIFFDFLAHSIQGTLLTRTKPIDETTSEFLEKNFIAPTEQKYIIRSRDSKLIRQAQENSEKFSEVYLTYRENIFQYFLKRLSYNTALAEDLSQETFVNAFSHLSQFSSSNASYQTYLLRIAHNILVNYYRHSFFSPLDEKALEQVQNQNTTIDLMDHYKLQKSLEKLKSDEREALELMYNEGYSIREIATKYKKTENAIKLKVSRARKKLQLLIQK